MKRLVIQFNAVILLLTVFSFHCLGADKYTLEYNLEKGKTYKQHVVLEMNMTMDFMGQTMQMDMKSEMAFHYDVTEQNKDGYDIRLTYQKMRIETSAPMPFIIDSDSPETSFDTSVGKAFQSIIGIPIDIQMTKQGKATSVKGMDKLMENLNTINNPQFKAMFDQQFSEQTIRMLLEQSSPFFPGKPVAIGESWEAVLNISTNGIDMISNMTLNLKQVKDNRATLELTGTLVTPEGGVTMNIQGMDAKVSVDGKQTGSIQMDLKSGWVLRSEITQISKQNIEIMGQTMLQEVETKTIVTAD